MTTGRLQSGVNTLQGFKEDKRNKVTPGEAPGGPRGLPVSQGATGEKPLPPTVFFTDSGRCFCKLN